MVTIALILFPLVAALILWVTSSAQAKKLALIFSLAELVLGGYALSRLGVAQTDLAANIPWLSFGANFAVNIDGISGLLVLLTTLLMPLIVLSSFKGNYSNHFYALMLLMQSALIGVFTATDGFLFYIFWELALIPIYFICLVWGGENSKKITFKFFVYTLGGSLIMLAGLLYVYFSAQTPSFAIESLYDAGSNMSKSEQGWVFWAMFLAFAIKMPVFPFHTWQPDTYTTSPTPGTMLLSGIMLKMGIYGVIRWLIPLVPEGWDSWGFTAMLLSIAGIVYASIIALGQNDFKRLIAYSSIAHVGLISAGVFSMTTEGLTGAMVQMLAHGINVIGLFFVADIIFDRYKTHNMDILGGVRSIAPQFALLFLIILLGSVALPLTNGFVGEFLLLNGIYQYGFWWAVFAGLTVILGAVYMLRAYQSIMLGEVKKQTQNFKDLDLNEKIVLVSVATLVIAMGVYPKPIISLVTPSVEAVIKSFQAGLIR
jgi:NADH-quinone oxidoreductase subunit M